MYVPSTGLNLAGFLVAINDVLPGKLDREIMEQLSSRCYDRLEGNGKFERLGYPKKHHFLGGRESKKPPGFSFEHLK